MSTALKPVRDCGPEFGRQRDDAWPSMATEIGLLELLGETVGMGILLIDLVFSAAILLVDVVLFSWR